MVNENMLNNTDGFIQKYCIGYSRMNPRPPMKNHVMINKRWDELLHDYKNVNHEAIKFYLKKVAYVKTYLTSYWWYIIRNKRILMDGEICSNVNCNNTTNLEVHHIGNDYEHRGEEAQFMGCIETLCRTCHAEKHPEKKLELKKDKGNVHTIILPNDNDEIELDLLHDKVEGLYCEDVNIVSDSKNHVIIYEQLDDDDIKLLSNDELRASILSDLRYLIELFK